MHLPPWPQVSPMTNYKDAIKAWAKAYVQHPDAIIEDVELDYELTSEPDYGGEFRHEILVYCGISYTRPGIKRKYKTIETLDIDPGSLIEQIFLAAEGDD